GGKFTTEFPATCGPYLMTEWTQKQRIVLKANPKWIGPAPAVEEIHIIFIEDDKAAEIAYEAGEIEFTEVSLDSFTRYKAKTPPNTKFFERPGLYWTWMGMNTEHPKLKDIRVRKAIQYAVDVDAIIQAAYGGVTPHSYGIVPPGLIGHRDS